MLGYSNVYNVNEVALAPYVGIHVGPEPVLASFDITPGCSGVIRLNLKPKAGQECG
jgi:hypothetical protein